MVDKTKKPVAVMPKQCRSCIFRHDGNELELRPGRLAEIQAYLIQGTPHLCHTPQIEGSKVEMVCRGGRDFQLQCWTGMGIISAPTDEALADAMRKAGVVPQES